jgi:hypothetical protein
MSSQSSLRCARAWLLALGLCVAAFCTAHGQYDDDFEQEMQPRDIVIAAIVGVRNVELSISPFLRLLAPFVDFTIVLDDSSTDGTVAAIQAVAQETKVKQVLIKDGSWNRSETSDRNELLLAGARISLAQSRSSPKLE